MKTNPPALSVPPVFGSLRLLLEGADCDVVVLGGTIVAHVPQTRYQNIVFDVAGSLLSQNSVYVNATGASS